MILPYDANPGRMEFSERTPRSRHNGTLRGHPCGDFRSLESEASVSFLWGITGANMDNTTLLISIVLVLLVFGGGYYGEVAGGDLSVNDGRRHPRRFRSARSRFSR